MEKKNLDWANLGFGYVKTDKRFVANYKDGAWDDGVITDDDKVVLNECAGVLQYAQTCFEGLKAYTTEDGHIVMFRPDLNAQRMHDSCERLEVCTGCYRYSKGKCSMGTAIWFRCYIIHPSIYVRQQSGYRCKAG